MARKKRGLQRARLRQQNSSSILGRHAISHTPIGIDYSREKSSREKATAPKKVADIHQEKDGSQAIQESKPPERQSDLRATQHNGRLGLCSPLYLILGTRKKKRDLSATRASSLAPVVRVRLASFCLVACAVALRLEGVVPTAPVSVLGIFLPFVFLSIRGGCLFHFLGVGSFYSAVALRPFPLAPVFFSHITPTAACH